MTGRLTVRKTYKLYVGGAFVRSESGRHRHAPDHAGGAGVNVPLASRKDGRDAVTAARKAAGPWADRDAYNRGQILYRCAEALESRAAELAAAGVADRGVSSAAAREELAVAVDVLVHHAGWTDKIAAVLGTINPVAGPHHSFTAPVATGVAVVLAPDEPDLLGLVREVAPALAAGNTVVVVASERWPRRSLDLGEVLDVSDVPAGVVNILTGARDELLDPLCGHRDVNAIVDATGDPALAERVDLLAADTVKRVVRLPAGRAFDDGALARIEGLVELRTAWHPVGV